MFERWLDRVVMTICLFSLFRSLALRFAVFLWFHVNSKLFAYNQYPSGHYTLLILKFKTKRKKNNNKTSEKKNDVVNMCILKIILSFICLILLTYRHDERSIGAIKYKSSRVMHSATTSSLYGKKLRNLNK
jgi:hypothetical protein